MAPLSPSDDIPPNAKVRNFGGEEDAAVMLINGKNRVAPDVNSTSGFCFVQAPPTGSSHRESADRGREVKKEYEMEQLTEVQLFVIGTVVTILVWLVKFIRSRWGDINAGWLTVCVYAVSAALAFFFAGLQRVAETSAGCRWRALHKSRGIDNSRPRAGLHPAQVNCEYRLCQTIL